MPIVGQVSPEFETGNISMILDPSGTNARVFLMSYQKVSYAIVQCQIHQTADAFMNQ